MSEAESLIVEVLRAADRPLNVPEIRQQLRRQGRTLSEDFIEHTCRAAAAVRPAGSGRFTLLSRFVEDAEAEPSNHEQDASPVSLLQLAALRRGSYVVFDLETTGTDPERDAIIQIGAVRIERGEPVRTFFEPVNPAGRRLEPALRKTLHIPEGGQMDQLILAAPSIDEVLPRFTAFVGDQLLVAHNGLGLDLPFLHRHGFPPEHPFFDSLELAFVARPAADSFGLEALAEVLSLPAGAAEVLEMLRGEPRVAGTTHHNALYDAAVLHLVVRRLLTELERAVKEASPYGRLLSAILPDVLGSQGEAEGDPRSELVVALTPTGFPTASHAAGSGDHPDPSNVAASFIEYIKRSGQELRESQASMVRLVSQTLTDGGGRLIEAPTGTGKSLGLAYPAVHHALASGERILLSTYTRNLQDQLENDIGLLRRQSGLPFRWCVLKGRGNYVCVTSLMERIRDESDPSSPARSLLDERLCVALLAGWTMHQAAAGMEGNLDSISFAIRGRLPAMVRVIDSVRAARSRCRDDRCSDTKGCFRAQARARAKVADLLLVNHCSASEHCGPRRGLS
jgi:DNA polymerase III epsilon subunit-like protein